MRVQFSLRTLLAVTFLVAVGTWWVQALRVNYAEMETTVTSLEAKGATIMYEKPTDLVMVRRIIGVEHGPRIGGLDFGNSQIRDLSFCTNRLLRNIERLEIHSSQIQDRHLESLLYCPQLRDLDMAGTNISDKCLPVICNLRHLEQVCVRKTAISESGVEAIRRAHPSCRVVP
jgi:hypothetical protein